MLKSLHIQNFQSHKDTTIQFTEGLNVIIGQSDGGKSSIIRALSAVCYNTWDSDSMRVGQHCCKLTLETDKGIVTLTKDTKSKINAYSGVKFQNNEQFSFESVGVTVPQIVNEITGMQPLKIADASVDIPNIMYQLDKHYMLAEVSGKTCTSNLIARIFDKVIGLGGMEELISQISSSMINDKKQITKKMAQVDELNSDLIDQLQLVEKQLNIKSAKKLKNEIQQLIFKSKKLDQFIAKRQQLQQRLSQINQRYIQLDVELVKNTITDLNDSISKTIKIDQLTQKSEGLKNQLKSSQNIIDMYKDLTLDELEEIKQICNKLYIANKTNDKYKLLTSELEKQQIVIKDYNELQFAEQLLNDSKQICNKLYKLETISSKICNKQKLLEDIEEQIKQSQLQYNQSSLKLQEVKKKNKICPLCGNLFQNCLQVK